MTQDLYHFVSAAFGTAFAVTLAIIGLSLWVVYYTTKYFTKIKTEHGQVVETNRELKEGIGKIKEEIIVIRGQLRLMTEDRPLTKSHSPISLTDDGELAAAELGARDMIEENWPKIDNAISAAGLTSAYDVQEFCFEKMIVNPALFISEENIHKIKNYAFEHGKSIEIYFRVFAVLIRDKYIAKAGLSENEPV